MKKFLMGLSALLCCQAIAQPQVSVAPYSGGRQAAVSYTFDDGLQDQFTLAYPELKKHGLRATFAVIGSKVGGTIHSSQDKAMGISGSPAMTWDMLRQLAADGHEISSHGWQHKKVQKLSAEELRYEVLHNDTVIFQQTGHFPRTYVFPGNSRDSATLAYCMNDRVGCRTFQIAIGSKRNTEWLNRWVDGLLEKGEWGVGMTHGIATGYDHFPDPSELWRHWDYVAAMQDRLWVAPLCEVVAYVKERDDVKLSINSTKRGFTVDIRTSLDPRIFTQPLTLIIDGSVNSATQNGRQLQPYHKDGNTLIDIDPHGGRIICLKSQRYVK